MLDVPPLADRDFIATLRARQESAQALSILVQRSWASAVACSENGVFVLASSALRGLIGLVAGIKQRYADDRAVIPPMKWSAVMLGKTEDQSFQISCFVLLAERAGKRLGLPVTEKELRRPTKEADKPDLGGE